MCGGNKMCGAELFVFSSFFFFIAKRAFLFLDVVF